MKALLLAAGRGTRMGALTEALPKPMVAARPPGAAPDAPLRPILETILSGLRDEAGITEVCIIVGWQAHIIRDHFGDGSAHGLKITYLVQEVQDGTGKAPELAREWIGDAPFFLSYGDILVPARDYRTLVDGFNEEPVGGVIGLIDGQDLTKGGAIVLDAGRRVIEIVEKAAPDAIPANAYYNSGLYILTPGIFTHTATLRKSPRGEYELTDALRGLAAGGKLKGVFLSEKWVDVRDPGVLAQLNGTS
ncbi:glucose-1-phosphate thymidylyltransferase/bifunctional UDP-N-acetylglucosamine pyrophosphorylase / Glucosamine-1-phosphate N-acetyltransferase [Verrucomicrobium sp. GAS474]|uniref:nucleotidyltransferase family protein n=1 Tax=Verrucomicrobium sp. GAS474 TaxID=1882831 RepID=UPI00087D56F8|nr:nucleotidyltransferase family protein [Verrucomicrobium sp. GAS474]SDT85854.1 glucose-1-phosphate thymidylyltransferase/bifunctional UDP-N-acetylglucosamine pyrophosphorylase / Glucosamine-1-phosphate N-acetyltransferase [Verrucomicrobium sp. GAS474]